MKFSTRSANNNDFEFLFELKKVAEFEAIKAIFGWDDEIQREIHHDEWSEERPTIIEISGNEIGSFLLQNKGDYFYFCRFFLLPDFHGKGIGSKILSQCLDIADSERKSIKLCYLQGNRVGELYHKFGFKVISKDAQFVYMQRQSTCL